MSKWAPFPNYFGLSGNTVLDYPGPAIINALNSPYRYNPTFDGFYAHNTQTSPHLNYLFDVVNGMQNETFQATQNQGNGFYPLAPWPQSPAAMPISQGYGGYGTPYAQNGYAYGPQASYPYMQQQGYAAPAYQQYSSPYAQMSYPASAYGAGANSFYI